jgi:hypothetical protein
MLKRNSIRSIPVRKSRQEELLVRRKRMHPREKLKINRDAYNRNIMQGERYKELKEKRKYQKPDNKNIMRRAHAASYKKNSNRYMHTTVKRIYPSNGNILH